jgi:dihydrofolate reductase
MEHIENNKKILKDINIIVATSTNYGIGYDNNMCWNISEELKNFKKITCTVTDETKKNCVIMGKNTWNSLPKKPLVNRINIIISSNNYDIIKKEYHNCEDIKVFNNLENVFEYVNNSDIIESAFIIGGALLYNECLEKHIDKIKYVYMSIIYDKKYECNKFIAANIIFNNFKFEKKDVYNSNLKYISMKGYNKGISFPVDEPPD